MGITLNILCSGTGYFSQFHYEAWSRANNAQILGVCNRNHDKAIEFSDRYHIENHGSDLEAMLAALKPDILDVITPPNTHLNAVKAAAKHGVNVICQKPFGENLEQAEAMVRIADEANIKLIIHENFRFMPWYRKIKTVLSEGLLGDVLNAQFNLRPGDGQGSEAYLARQPYFQEMPKFLVHETAIHLVDTFRYLFGEPRSLYAQLRRCNPVIRGEDSGVIVFEFPNQLQAIFDGNRLVDHQATNTRKTMGELNIAGTKGELKLDGDASLWFRKFGEQTFNPLEFEYQDQNFGGDCVYETIDHIIQHFVKGTELENQGFEYLKNIKIENAIYLSSKEGRRINSKEFYFFH